MMKWIILLVFVWIGVWRGRLECTYGCQSAIAGESKTRHEHDSLTGESDAWGRYLRFSFGIDFVKTEDVTGGGKADIWV